ncbi:MAG: hypothetical protein ACREM3_10410 [Candidatus Rokuibacteriota bacterium]
MTARPVLARWLVKVAPVVLALSWAGETGGFVLRPDPPQNRLTMNLDLPTTIFTSLGYGPTSWNALAASALAEWNVVGIGNPPDHQFFSVRVPPVIGNPCSQDGINEARFAPDVCGLSWGDSIGITSTWSVNGKVIEADVLFRPEPQIRLDAYPGPIISEVGETLFDFYRLALHEFGHAAGLLHPNLDGGQNVVAVMNSGNQVVGGVQSAIGHLQPDDVGGARAIAWSGSTLVAAVLPSSRSVQVGTAATAFATIINLGQITATQCSLSPPPNLPATFTYQTTTPATNELTGTADTPVNIPPGVAQSFVFAFTPSAAIASTDVTLTFTCGNAGPAPSHSGLNTLLLSASTTPIPDIVALGATLAGNGIVNIPGTTGTGAFAVATVNVGAGSTITASADTGAGVLPITLSLCQTNPGTGACLSGPTPTVTTTINAGATPTFAVFATGRGSVPFAPAFNRIHVRFKDVGGVTRGATSVAVTTQ